MYKAFRRAGFAGLLFVLAGCAGKDFVRPASDTFQLGRTSHSQVVQKMGEPSRSGDLLTNDKSVKSISYVYASTMGQPLEGGVVPARGLTYYFYDDTLVGQEFISSFKSDNTNFDNTKVESVKKGKTTTCGSNSNAGKANCLICSTYG